MVNDTKKDSKKIFLRNKYYWFNLSLIIFLVSSLFFLLYLDVISDQMISSYINLKYPSYFIILLLFFFLFNFNEEINRKFSKIFQKNNFLINLIKHLFIYLLIAYLIILILNNFNLQLISLLNYNLLFLIILVLAFLNFLFKKEEKKKKRKEITLKKPALIFLILIGTFLMFIKISSFSLISGLLVSTIIFLILYFSLILLDIEKIKIKE